MVPAWELGTVLDLDEVTSGSVNRVFRVATGRGTFYLRVYRIADVRTVEREHALIAHVAAAGLPAVAPVAAASGATVVLHAGTPIALYPEAGGVQIAKRALGVEHAAMAGDMLGRLHQCMESLPDAGYRNYALRWPARAWIERLAAIADAIGKRSAVTDADARVLERIEHQCSWLSDPRCVHAYRPAFAPQVIHGDYQHANLFFARHGVSGIIDWEQAAHMPRAYEAARTVAYMFDLEPEPTRAFLAAYRSVTAMTDEELDDGARAWGCMSDHYVWAVEEVYLHGNERARPFISAVFRPFHLAFRHAIGSATG